MKGAEVVRDKVRRRGLGISLFASPLKNLSS